jgi:hypothetical protein
MILRNRLALIGVASAVLYTLAACAVTDESDGTVETEPNQVEDAVEDPDLSPPGLTIQVGEETVRPVLGIYRWSIDNEDGTTTTTVVDAAAPPELVRTMDPVETTPDMPVTFDFEEEPDDYSIRIWEDETTTTGSSSDIDLSGQGEVVYEVQAEWEQGEASYAFSLILE